mgnify:CR=1 FL=1
MKIIILSIGSLLILTVPDIYMCVCVCVCVGRYVYIWTIYEIFNQTRECKNKISRIKIEI